MYLWFSADYNRNHPCIRKTDRKRHRFSGKPWRYHRDTRFSYTIYRNEESGNSGEYAETDLQGMRQRLGIAQAIMEDPRLLILDEPFNGLDKHGVAEIRELLLELKAAGKTILLASHNEEDIRILCDHVYEMDGGILKERTG